MGDWSGKLKPESAELLVLKERLRRMHSGLDDVVVAAMQFGSGGAAIIAASVKNEIEAMLGDAEGRGEG